MICLLLNKKPVNNSYWTLYVNRKATRVSTSSKYSELINIKFYNTYLFVYDG